MNRWTVILAAAMFVSLVALGCSGGGNPVAPSAPDLTNNAQVHGNTPQNVLWGMYDFYINTDSGTVEFVPNRSQMWNANVVTFLNNSPANMAFTLNLLDIGITDPNAILVDIDVTLNHPFPGMDQFNGYDVRGIFMGGGSGTLNYDSDLIFPMYKVDQFLLDDPVNMDGGGPDGYTRWYNGTEFTMGGVLGFTPGNYGSKNFTPGATLCPYKYFADNIMIEDDPFDFLVAHEAENAVFSAGASNTRNYYLEFPLPDPSAKYQYAVVASWEAPDVHPANTIEAPAISVTVTDDVYFVDGTTKGGDLILDIDVWGWNYQPSSIVIESSVLSSNYIADTSMPVGGGAHYSTYHVEVPADAVAGIEDNWFWVIPEYAAFDYNNQYSIDAFPMDPLAAFFKYDLFVADTPYCTTSVISIDPVSAYQGDLVSATITCSELEDGAFLDAKLQMEGQDDIQGENITYVDEFTLTCDFQIDSSTEEGLWDVYVMNGCGGTPGVGAELFEVFKTGGLKLIDDGDLPTPLPFPTVKNFCVVGNNVSNYAGVYYFGDNYNIYKYPVDYSAAGSLYFQMQGNYGYGQYQCYGNTNELTSIEVDPSGGVIVTSSGTNMFFGSYTVRQTIAWFAANNPLLSNALTLSSAYGTVHNRDTEAEYSAYGVLWGFWATVADFNYAGNDVEIVMTGIGYPYGSGNYTTGWSINWGPLDESAGGSLDGEVSNIESKKLAVDSAPVGLSGGYDIIHYYLEGDPDDPTIEVFANIKSSLGAADSLITTIDETNFEGTPIDISTIKCYPTWTDSAGNWLAVLEDNGDGTWQPVLFTQDGDVIERYSTPIDGTPLALDCDNTNLKIHVWADDSGTLRYYVFEYV